MRSKVMSVVVLFFIIQIVFLPYTLTSAARAACGESRTSMLLASAAASQFLASARARYFEDRTGTFGTPAPICCAAADTQDTNTFISDTDHKPSDKEHSLTMLVVSRK